MADALFGLPSKMPKLPSGMATAKPSMWEIIDGVLGGDTITEARYKAQARKAALADIGKRSAMSDRIAAMLAGEDDPQDVPSAPASMASPAPAVSRRMGPSLDEGMDMPEAPAAAPPQVPAVNLPSKRRFDPDRLNRVLTAAAYMGDEGAGKAAEVMSKLKPDLDKGLYMDRDGRVLVREGYADASRTLSQASTAGAEAAKADFDVIAVPLPDGSSVQMPRGVYIQLQRSGAMPDLGRSQTPGARVRAEAEARAPTEFITYQDAQGRPVTAAKSAIAGQVLIGQDDADGEYQKKGAQAAADRFKALQDAGSKAPGLISKYQQVDRLLGDFEGGKLSPLGLEVASAFNSLGFKMDPKLSNAQAADAIVKQITLDSLGGGLGVAISNSDRDFIEKTQPSLQTSAAGRRTLVQMQVKSLQRQQQVAQFARQWQQRFGRIDTPDASGKTFEDYLQAWAEQNRLFTGQGKR